MTVPTTGASGANNPSVTGRLLDELAGLALPVVMPLVRRLPALILVFAALVSVMGVLTLVAARRDDARIDAHRATAIAEVLPGSTFMRTLVTFTTQSGDTVSPERGVFYPSGLRPGQLVRVEYDSTAPDLVRVAGRDASVGTWPVVLLLVVTWGIALPVGFSLRGRQLREIEATRLAMAEAEAVKAAVAAEAAAGKALESAGKASEDGPSPSATDTAEGSRTPAPGQPAVPEYRPVPDHAAVPDYGAGPSRD